MRGQEWCWAPCLCVPGEKPKEGGPPAKARACQVTARGSSKTKIIWRTLYACDRSHLFWAQWKPRGSEAIRRAAGAKTRCRMEIGKPSSSQREQDSTCFLPEAIPLEWDLGLRAWAPGGSPCFGLGRCSTLSRATRPKGSKARHVPWAQRSRALWGL